MLNNSQIKLVQTAVKAAGLRGKGFDGRYRLLLGQYRQISGRPVTSCKQLNNFQIDDLLAICEAHGWRCPGKEENHFRHKLAKSRTAGDIASFAQQEAIKHLAGDLGWGPPQLGGFIERMTEQKVSSIESLTPSQAYKIIEALKAMFGRQVGKQFNNLKEIEREVRDGETRQVG